MSDLRVVPDPPEEQLTGALLITGAIITALAVPWLVGLWALIRRVLRLEPDVR